jgi:hypothetical protein
MVVKMQHVSVGTEDEDEADPGDEHAMVHLSSTATSVADSVLM